MRIENDPKILSTLKDVKKAIKDGGFDRFYLVLGNEKGCVSDWLLPDKSAEETARLSVWMLVILIKTLCADTSGTFPWFLANISYMNSHMEEKGQTGTKPPPVVKN